MKVTVIIPNYNGRHFLRDCMRGLATQTFRDFEVLIVDNASTDNSIDFIEEYYPQTRIMRMETNTGFSGAVNAGIKASNTPYIILLNNDTKPYPGYVGELVKAIEASPKIFSVSAKMVQMAAPGYIDDTGDLYNLIGWGFQRGVAHPAGEYNKSAYVFSACAGAAIYRRNVFYEIGFFDENHFAYLEDMDIGYRAKIYGYRNFYCPTAIVEHVGSGTSGSKYNPFKVKLAARNSVYMIYKNMPALQLLINALPLGLGYLLKYRFFKKMGFEREFIQGIKDGFGSLNLLDKVPFRLKHFMNYCLIEFELIQNMFIYVKEYTHRSQPE